MDLPQDGKDCSVSDGEEWEEEVVTMLVRVEKDQLPYKCGLCAMTFEDVDRLEVHIENHGPVRPYGCGYCRKTFGTNQDLSAHLVTAKHDVQQQTLVMPGKLPGDKSEADHFPSGKRSNLNVTVLEEQSAMVGDDAGRVTAGQAVRTEVNMKGMASKKQRPREVNAAGSNNPNCVSCPSCKQIFQRPVDLKKHSLEKHNDDRPFWCSQCPLRYKQKVHLTYHMNTAHSSHKPHTCPKCGDRFKLRGHLRYHLSSKHHVEPSTILFRKPRSSIAGALANQMLTGESTGTQPFAAQDPTLSDDKDGHKLRTQTGSSCEEDGTSNVKTASGTGDPVVCPTCGQSFQLLVDLKKHSIMEHYDDRPFLCPYCPLRYKQKIHLTYHVKSVHSSMKPHPCPLCGDRFKLRGHLRYHLLSRHGVEPSTILKRPSRKLSTTTGHVEGEVPAATQTVVDSSQQAPSLNERGASEGVTSALSGRGATAHVDVSPSDNQPLSGLLTGRSNVAIAAGTSADTSDSVSCPRCSLSFQRPVDLKKHSLQEHGIDRPFQCPLCTACYKQKIHLTYHVNSVHSSRKPHVCPVCADKFKLRVHLKYHVLSKHRVEPSSILQRQSRISGLFKIGSVIDKASSSSLPVCPESDIDSASTVAARDAADDEVVSSGKHKHRSVSSRASSNICKPASGKGSTVEVWQKLKCGVCSITFSSYIRLRDHWVCAHSACECGEKFEDPCTMGGHKRSVHRESKDSCRPYLCAVCGTDFDSTRCLREHIYSLHKKTGGIRQTWPGKGEAGPRKRRTHLKKRQKQFEESTRLAAESVCSVREKCDCKCGFCGKTFSSLAQIRDHWKHSHNKCVCGKKFTNPRGLLSHRNSAHRQAKSPISPFLCCLCGAGFQVARYLADHVCRPHSVADKGQTISQKSPQTEHLVYRTRGAAAKLAAKSETESNRSLNSSEVAGIAINSECPAGRDNTDSHQLQGQAVDHAYSLPKT